MSRHNCRDHEQLGIETWLPVGGFDWYEVSDRGRVRSWRRPGLAGGPAAVPRILAPRAEKGYLRVCLMGPNGTKHNRYVHRLVAAAFIGEPHGREVAHNDGCPANCALGNLRYATRQENEDDKKLHGTRPRGELLSSAKLTAECVRLIREGLARGQSKASLAREFGVSRTLIYNVASNRAWTHVARAVA